MRAWFWRAVAAVVLLALGIWFWSVLLPSPERILIRQGREYAIGIVPSANRLRYEIEANNSHYVRR